MSDKSAENLKKWNFHFDSFSSPQWNVIYLVGQFKIVIYTIVLLLHSTLCQYNTTPHPRNNSINSSYLHILNKQTNERKKQRWDKRTCLWQLMILEYILCTSRHQHVFYKFIYNSKSDALSNKELKTTTQPILILLIPHLPPSFMLPHPQPHPSSLQQFAK